jgi:hypothetical protein
VPLSIKEALAVNTLLEWVFQYAEKGVTPSTEVDAMAAAAVLADLANDTLAAGLTGEQVRDLVGSRRHLLPRPGQRGGPR